MFEVGDNVWITSLEKPVHGKIVGHYFDEGNVWVVLTDGGNYWDCCDNELRPA